jgi:hypothetical protein
MKDKRKTRTWSEEQRRDICHLAENGFGDIEISKMVGLSYAIVRLITDDYWENLMIKKFQQENRLSVLDRYGENY